VTVHAPPILEVIGFSGGFPDAAGDLVPVLNEVGFAIPHGSSAAIVGRSPRCAASTRD
jgi:hypothetical protein